MAKMLPPLSDEFIFRSEAERAVYEYLMKNTPDSWAVLYSVWLKTSKKKEHAEIDFLVITDDACLCLEVKGHKVWRDDNGTWHFETLSGSKHRTSNEGPFDQAREARYALKNYLVSRRKSSLYYNLTWGHGVVTPDCALDVPSGDSEVSSAMLADFTVFPEKMESYFKQLSEYWYERLVLNKKGKHRSLHEIVRVVPQQIRDELALTIRPAIKPLEGVGVRGLSAARKSEALTSQQYIALEHAELDPRIVLYGRAGTGKTLIALEKARREALSKSVLFVCFNSKLAAMLTNRCQSLGEENITVLNYHQLVKFLLAEAGIDYDLSYGWKEFNKQALELVGRALQRIPDFQVFDYLVVDEAQDLLASEFFDVLDLLLVKGLEGGEWCICLDPEQVIFSEQYDQFTHDSILQLGRRVSLSVNCRNTKPIAAYFSGISNISKSPVRAGEGPDVVLEYYDDFEDYERKLKKCINLLVGEFKKAKLHSTDIVLLTPKKQYITNLSTKILDHIILPIEQYDEESASDNKVYWSTIQSFKGLESMAVILVGMEELESVESRRIFYVGASRARVFLTALLPKTVEKQISNALPRIIEALS